MAIEVPFISDAVIRAQADEFARIYNSEGMIPVPIEEIIEFQFEMDIISMPGFARNYEVDAFISTCLTEIRIDKGVAESRNKNRYRFSLAHELSHRLLHPDIFRQLRFTTIAEWKDSRSAIPLPAYNRLEFQANMLAGLILVPPLALAGRFAHAKEKAERIGVSLDSAREEAWEMIERFLADEFSVSQYVIRIRGQKDGLWQV